MQEAGSTRGIGARDIAVLVRACVDHDVLARVARVDRLGRGNSVEPGHADVHQHDVRSVFLGEAHGLVAGRRTPDDREAAVCPQRLQNELREAWVVLADQNAQRAVRHEGGDCHSGPYDAAVIIDGHNDLVLHCWRGEPTMHLDLEAAMAAGFAGGFFALYVPSPGIANPPDGPYSLPLPQAVAFEDAAPIAEEQYEQLCALPVGIARSPADFRAGDITAIVHMEGAEAIAPDLSNLESWYERGLRSIGLVWSRPNEFAEGVPFRFPSGPDTGPGLTDAGRRLVRACNDLGIVVDLSHLNERGFWDVAETSNAPLVATHSNAHALCASSRNLTDAQLDAISASGGMVGVNFAVTFLREDGRQLPEETGLDEIVRHVDYLAERMGIDHVAFGSDFDGALIPTALGDVAGLPRLVDALRSAGHSDAEVAKITHENWLRVLGATWH